MWEKMLSLVRATLPANRPVASHPRQRQTDRKVGAQSQGPRDYVAAGLPKGYRLLIERPQSYFQQADDDDEASTNLTCGPT